MNVARLIGFLGELPISVAGATVNRFCGSSMQAIHMAAGAIQLDAGEVFVCAGVELMTRVPIGGYNPLPQPEARGALPPGLHEHGRDRRERRPQVPDHAPGAAGVRGREPSQGGRRTGRGQARRRDRADQGERPHGRGRRLHPRGHQPGGARQPEARLRRERHRDGRHLVAADRRRRGDPGLHRGLCGEARARAARPDQERSRRRLPGGDHGHRPGRREPQGAGARRPRHAATSRWSS